MKDEVPKSKTLKYFLDNKNFAKPEVKKVEKRKNMLQVVDDKIILNADSNNAVEDDHVTSYTYMKNKGMRKKWSSEENEMFYRSLECCGCDFSMMNVFFPDRPRNNLKQKYKKELKRNKQRVEECLKNFKNISLDKFNDLKEAETNMKR